MAFIMRAVILSMLFTCNMAMFKRDMRTVEHQFPDLGGLSDTLKNVAQGAQDIVSQGKNAVEAVKDVTLDVFKSSAGQVNQSLKVLGGEILKMNVTAFRGVNEIEEKVKMAEDKTAAFAEGASDMIDEVEPIFDQMVEQLQSVTKMAGQVLRSLNQEHASWTLEDSMDSALTTLQHWKSAMEDLSEKLSTQITQITGRTRRVARRAARRNASVPANVTSLAQGPAETLSEALQSPLAALKSAADELKDAASQTSAAMGKFVDGAVEAAKEKVPGDLIDNVTSIMKGVQAECEADLAPLGDIGTQLVNGLYKAGKDAGLNLNSMAALSAVPSALLALVFCWF